MKTSNLAVETKSAVSRKKSNKNNNNKWNRHDWAVVAISSTRILWASVTIKTIVSHAFIFSVRRCISISMWKSGFVFKLVECLAHSANQFPFIKEWALHFILFLRMMWSHWNSAITVNMIHQTTHTESHTNTLFRTHDYARENNAFAFWCDECVAVYGKDECILSMWFHVVKSLK